MTDHDSSQFELDELRRRWLESPTPKLSIQLAEQYRRRGRPRQAVEVLEESLQQNAEHLGARVALGRYRIEMGEPEEAVRQLEMVAAKDPTHLVANKLLVGLHLDMGNERQARDRLDLYSLLNAGDPEIDLLESRFGTARGVPEAEAGPDEEADAPGEPAVAGGELFHLGEPPPPPAFPPTEPVPHAAEVDPSEPFPELFDGLEDATLWSADAAAAVFELGPPEIFVSSTSVPGDFAATGTGVPAPEVDTDLPEAPTAAATATLGRLYLEQGHVDEAESTFRELLEQRPGSAEALRGLAAVRSRREGWLTAAELLADEGADEREAAPGERKARLLHRYLDRLRSGMGRS